MVVRDFVNNMTNHGEVHLLDEEIYTKEMELGVLRQKREMAKRREERFAKISESAVETASKAHSLHKRSRRDDDVQARLHQLLGYQRNGDVASSPLMTDRNTAEIRELSAKHPELLNTLSKEDQVTLGELGIQLATDKLTEPKQVSQEDFNARVYRLYDPSANLSKDEDAKLWASVIKDAEAQPELVEGVSESQKARLKVTLGSVSR